MFTFNLRRIGILLVLVLVLIPAAAVASAVTTYLGGPGLGWRDRASLSIPYVFDQGRVPCRNRFGFVV